ncbi:Uma2 family endonuclease [Botrimarina sp.]|uniref:Uma2 family endonuclease n=1 Tax=Botrimarina sp. TaxID=2795802 RepID=UPI0032ED415B
MDWSEIVDNPYLADLPFKIEQDRYGNIVMSPASNRHAELQAEIAYLLRKLKPEGKSLTECSVATPEGVKSPDVAWADNAFIAANRMSTPFASAPAICVEVLSPSNSRAEITLKSQLYFDAGAEEVWICDDTGAMEFRTPDGVVASSLAAPTFPKQID